MKYVMSIYYPLNRAISPLQQCNKNCEYDYLVEYKAEHSKNSGYLKYYVVCVDYNIKYIKLYFVQICMLVIYYIIKKINSYLQNHQILFSIYNVNDS